MWKKNQNPPLRRNLAKSDFDGVFFLDKLGNLASSLL